MIRSRRGKSSNTNSSYQKRYLFYSSTTTALPAAQHSLTKPSTMAILNYFSVTSATTPITPDSPATPPSNQKPTNTKITLPKSKQPKLWTAAASTEAPPATTTNPKKFWGPKEEDPLTSDDYIWNREFMGTMKRLIEDTEEASLEQGFIQEESSGFLSLSRVMSLDSLDVDLSKELTKPANAAVERQVEEFPVKSNGRTSAKWKLAPTRREQEKWNRASKAATGGSEVMLNQSSQPQGDPRVLAAQSREQYNKLKLKLQLLTLGVGGVGLASAYISYSPEVAASFGAGLLGSLVYIRMLGTSVDGLAAGSTGAVKGAVTQPRLLIPVVLVMLYNRWNEILVPERGFMHLELIPMLVGFFTYKIATFIQALDDVVSVVDKKTQA